MANCLNFGKRYEDDNQYFSNPIRSRFLEIFQVGELYCEAGFEIEKHRQRVFEITYVVTGKGTVFMDGRAYPVSENDVVITTIGQAHEIRADRGTPLRFCYLGFLFAGRLPAELEAIERFYRSFKGDTVVSDKALLTAFSKIFDELHEQNDFFVTMLGSYAEQIVTAVYRATLEKTTGRVPSIGDSRGGSAAFTVARYIDQHYRDIDDIRELAAHLGYSYTYLAHIFKDKIGITIGSYIIMKKMDEAKWLLRSGRMNVSQIASRFNYRSVQSFSNSFKKAVGISPAEYQALSADEAEQYH